jgi:hypothetical protein
LPLATAPRLAELCFQAAGLWQAGLEGRLALPTRIGRLRLHRAPAQAALPLRATARETTPGRFDCQVIDAKGQLVLQLQEYGTIPLPAPIPEAVAAVLRATFQR